jgi:uncharacterized protein YecT (DUF1311 family)
MSIASFILIAASVSPQIASVPTGQAIVNRCWEGHDHPQMSACVNEQASAARSSLARVELSLRESLARQHKTASVSLLRSAADSYQAYRTKQCHLQGVLASAGNGAAEISLACEAALDMARSEQLKAGLEWVAPGA